MMLAKGPFTIAASNYPWLDLEMSDIAVLVRLVKADKIESRIVTMNCIGESCNDVIFIDYATFSNDGMRGNGGMIKIVAPVKGKAATPKTSLRTLMTALNAICTVDPMMKSLRFDLTGVIRNITPKAIINSTPKSKSDVNREDTRVKHMKARAAKKANFPQGFFNIDNFQWIWDRKNMVQTQYFVATTGSGLRTDEYLIAIKDPCIDEETRSLIFDYKVWASDGSMVKDWTYNPAGSLIFDHNNYNYKAWTYGSHMAMHATKKTNLVPNRIRLISDGSHINNVDDVAENSENNAMCKLKQELNNLMNNFTWVDNGISTAKVAKPDNPSNEEDDFIRYLLVHPEFAKELGIEYMNVTAVARIHGIL